MTESVHIWVDSDAFPIDLRKMVFKAARRLELPCTLVANRDIRVPPDENIKSIRVTSEEDAADHYIVERVTPNDLVITADIPLAAAAAEKGATVLDFRGDILTVENVRERLSMRDFMKELRDSGVETGGPRAFGPKDKQNFAAAFDRTLSRLVRGG